MGRGYTEVYRGGDGLQFWACAAIDRRVRFSGMSGSSLDPKAFCKPLAAVGIQYEQTLQGLIDIRQGDGHSAATLVVSDSAALMPYNWQQPRMVHPVTLDATFWAAYTPLSPSPYA